MKIFIPYFVNSQNLIKMNGTGYCGVDATCTNTVGSFTCTCETGYVEHTPWQGCRDKNECTEGGNDCKANTDCTNTIGSWNCTCKVGFTGDPKSGCTDIDECSHADLNTCSGGMYPHGFNTDLFGKQGNEDFKQFYVGTGDDGYSNSFRFEMKGNGALFIKLCQNGEENCYIIAGFKTLVLAKKDEEEMTRKVFGGYTALKLDTEQYKAVIIDLIKEGDEKLRVELKSAYDSDAYLSWTDTQDILAVDTVHLMAKGDGSLYIRKFKKNIAIDACLNNVGSFVCISTEEEYMGIGFGGHTTSGSTYTSEVSVVTSEEISCANHAIPNLAGRYSPGVLAMDNFLFVCGGHYSGYNYPLNDCQKLDMDAETPSWQTFVTLPGRRRDFPLLKYDNYMYVIGGYEYWDGGSSCRSNVWRIKADGTSWKSRASYPMLIHRHCGVADQDHDRLYVVGGHDCDAGGRAEVYYYTVSSNTWTHHSTMPWGGTYDCSCGVVKQKNGERWLMVVRGNANGAVIYWNIDANNGWHHPVNLYGNYKQAFMSMISLKPYTALMLGGYSQRHGHSLRNFWTYNPETYRFEDTISFIRNEHKTGQWTVAKKTYRSLANCNAERAYAAVGWGGHTTSGSEYPSEWSVLLRKRRTSGDPHLPVRCDTAIPDLSPGRYWPGVTAVGYNLLVCGGHPSGQNIQTYGHQCFHLDTNSSEPVWEAMDDMPIKRAYFEFETYGDAAYAIAGHNGDGEISRVDRYTRTNGWEQMANYPHDNHRFCAVADEGHDRIYSLGGSTKAHRKNAYYYNVKANSWSGMTGLKYWAYDIGCAITTMRNGNRYLIVTGITDQLTQYFDLTSWRGWSKLEKANSDMNRPSLVSLTPTESYQVGGWTRTHGYHARNWWLWNPVNNRYEDHGVSMRRQHCGGDWTRIPEDALVLRSCSLL